MLSPDEIEEIDEAEHLVQHVFTRYFIVSNNVVCDWMYGAMKPGVSALRPLEIIRRNSVDVLPKTEAIAVDQQAKGCWPLIDRSSATLPEPLDG